MDSAVIFRSVCQAVLGVVKQACKVATIIWNFLFLPNFVQNIKTKKTESSGRQC